MLGKNKKRNGFFIVEIMVSLALLGMLIAGLTISMHGLAKFNLYQLVRQRCVAAAQAQLDSISSTGKTISDEEIKRLWPKIEMSVEQKDGTGQWEGLTLFTIKTRGMSYNTPVKVELSRYIRIQEPIKELEQSK
ncbi:MAG: type II secretion system protein [Sedimentisphaerales bacterium]